MKNLKIFLLILASQCFFSQNNFQLEINAKEYVNDSLWFGVPEVRAGFEDLYNFKLDENKGVNNLSKKMGFPFSYYSLNIDEENLIKGNVKYPQPVAFLHINPNGGGSGTDIFFIEKGKFTIDLPKISNGMNINLSSPTNIEYKKLKEILKPVYQRIEGQYARDSLVDFSKKQEIIAKYIKENPNSFAALWEIVDDYKMNNYHSSYLVNMNLFSKKFQQNELFKKLQQKLINERESLVGKIIPDIYFDSSNSLTKEDFKKYKLTFIDYWSTTCAPCIKGLPDIVRLQNEYKDKNVNFISVTDENKKDRILLANNILTEIGAKWVNYFDVNKDFSKKVNATGYPLQFIIDNEGKIIARIFGDLEEIEKILAENTK